MQIGNVVIDNVLLPVNIKRKKKSINLINSIGGVKSCLSGYEELFIEINVRIFNYNNLLALEKFLTENADYRKNAFQIIPEESIDLGNGCGLPVTVRYWSDEFKFIVDESLFYNTTLIFRKEV